MEHMVARHKPVLLTGLAACHLLDRYTGVELRHMAKEVRKADPGVATQIEDLAAMKEQTESEMAPHLCSVPEDAQHAAKQLRVALWNAASVLSYTDLRDEFKVFLVELKYRRRGANQ